MKYFNLKTLCKQRSEHWKATPLKCFVHSVTVQWIQWIFGSKLRANIKTDFLLLNSFVILCTHTIHPFLYFFVWIQWLLGEQRNTILRAQLYSTKQHYLNCRQDFCEQNNKKSIFFEWFHWKSKQQKICLTINSINWLRFSDHNRGKRQSFG